MVVVAIKAIHITKQYYNILSNRITVFFPALTAFNGFYLNKR